MEDFKKRLLEFIERQYGISNREFERMCKLPNGTISSIKVKGPSADVLYRISDNCPFLNMNWLLTGRGEMLNRFLPGTDEQPSILCDSQNVVYGYGNHHNTQTANDPDLWKKLCEEKDKRIAELERTIQILLNK